MALPQLNASPKYELTIPSTGQEVRFRPYLVKEEKVLMLAMESQDEKQMYAAIADTIESCVVEPVNRRILTSFDIEYMFTQIRCKSVGESAKVILKCNDCEHDNEVSVQLDAIVVDKPEVNSTIKLTPDISIEMKWPTYQTILDADVKDAKQTAATFDMLMGCINKVLTAEEQIVFADEPKKDKMAFLESLDTKQFQAIQDYMEKMPTMKSDVEFVCENCGHSNKYTLQGMNDFF